MKQFFTRLALPLLLVSLMAQPALAQELIPVGQVVGLTVDTGSVTVAAFSDDSPALQAGLRLGDRLLQVNGQPISTVEDVRAALQVGSGQAELVVQRENRQETITVLPRQGQIGVYLRRGVSGIGTVTYYHPESGDFGALGHGICQSPGTAPVDGQGRVYHARVTAVRPGQSGKPGQLLGTITDPEPFASLTANTPQGVFGKTPVPFSGSPVSTGTAREGEAVILCTVDGGTPQEYSVQICRVYPATRKNGRNLLLQVTDPALLSVTGGIVQGMSGSPIIQDGKLIGAVTHVLVNDPTMGYGIFIESMLDAAA